jgi:hypothetical protein
MTIRDDLASALMSSASDGREADTATKMIFDGVAAALLRRFPGLNRDDIDFALADVQGRTNDLLDQLITGAINLDAAIDVIATRFFD